MRIAIASTDGERVNQHFGKTDKFLIYETGATGLDLLSVKHVRPLSVGDRSHGFEQERFDAVAKVLTGCERVYCLRIGERPAAELKKMGIEAVVYEGPIDTILSEKDA